MHFRVKAFNQVNSMLFSKASEFGIVELLESGMLQNPTGFSTSCKHVCSVPWRGEINLVVTSDPCEVSVARSPPHHPECAFSSPFLMLSLPTFPSASLRASGMSLLAMPLRQPSTKPSPGSQSSRRYSSPSVLLFQNSLLSNITSSRTLLPYLYF